MGVIRVLYFTPSYRASLTQRCGVCGREGRGRKLGPVSRCHERSDPRPARGPAARPLACMLASYLKPGALSVLAWLALAASIRDVRRGAGRAREKGRGSRAPCAPPILPTDCGQVKDIPRRICLLCVMVREASPIQNTRFVCQIAKARIFANIYLPNSASGQSCLKERTTKEWSTPLSMQPVPDARMGSRGCSRHYPSTQPLY